MKRVGVGVCSGTDKERTDRNLIWQILVIGVLAFGIRLAYVFLTKEYTNLEADEMQRAAISLARDGYLGNIFVGSPGKSAHVAPLYAAFLGCIYYFFGWDTTTGRLVADIFAAAVSSVGIALLPVVARKARLPKTSGLISGIFMAIFPLNLWNETSGIWEQPYSALMLILLLLAFCRLHEEHWNSRRTVFLVGALIGIAALLSPSLLPAVFLMFVGEWLFQAKRKQVFMSGVFMFLVSLAFITPWIIRNYYAFGGFVPVRSNFGLELIIGNNPYATGKTFITYADDPDSPAYKMHPNSSLRERARLAEIGELAYMREKQKTAIQWMKDNPRRTLELTLNRFRLFWFTPKDAWTRTSPYRGLKSLIFCLIALWMFGELIELYLFQHPYKWLLVFAALGPSIIYIITHSDPRYRYPIFGLSTLLAFNFLHRVWNFLKGLSKARIVTEAA
jgi:hypothetical protein